MPLRTTGQRGTPRALFRIDNRFRPEDLALFPSAYIHETTPDGERFLIGTQVRDPDAPPINIAVGWPALLNQ